jgi:NADPH:quinone reductase-like Zn-dependent oxidoreductase
VQLATISGAHVTAVCSGPNAGLVRSLGATTVVDYTKEDFTRTGTTYDVIVDCVGNVPFQKLQPLIKPGGALLSVTADLPGVLAARLRAHRTGIHITTGNVPFIAADLAHIAQLAETGQLRPVIDRSFALTDIAEAHRQVSTGRKRGNVVVQIAGQSTRRPSVETK